MHLQFIFIFIFELSQLFNPLSICYVYNLETNIERIILVFHLKFINCRQMLKIYISSFSLSSLAFLIPCMNSQQSSEAKESFISLSEMIVNDRTTQHDLTQWGQFKEPCFLGWVLPCRFLFFLPYLLPGPYSLQADYHVVIHSCILAKVQTSLDVCIARMIGIFMKYSSSYIDIIKMKTIYFGLT